MPRPQIFMCYSRKDRERVAEIYGILAIRGFKPWMDKNDILAGEDWKSAIRAAIRQADFMLIFLSNESVGKAGFLQKEIKEGLEIWEERPERDIYLIPIKLENCVVPASLQNFQWINVYDNAGIDLLVRHLLLATEKRTNGKTLELNDSPFHRFWNAMIGSRHLQVIHGEPVDRPKKDGHWPKDKDRQGIHILNRTFFDAWPHNPLVDHSSEDPIAEDIIQSSDVLLCGSSVSNRITRNYFNHFAGIRYAVDYTMPGHTDIRVQDKISSTAIYSDYTSNPNGKRTLLRDIGILTIMRSPLSTDRILIGCMGIHGFGSLGCCKALTDPALLKDVLHVIDLSLPCRGYQLLVECQVPSERASLRENSLHKIE